MKFSKVQQKEQLIGLTFYIYYGISLSICVMAVTFNNV